MTHYLVATLTLTLVYALALASFHPWDLAFGALLAAALVFGSRRFVFSEGRGQKPSPITRVGAFVPFAAVILWDILVGTLEVTLVTLHLRPLVKPGIVAVPIGDRTPSGIAAWAIVTGLPPGSFFVDLDRERGVALIHLLDARDPEGFCRRQADFYRRYQSRVFP